MSGPKWLDGYTGQSTDALIALDGAFRTDSIALAFEQAIQRKAVRIGDPNLTTPERVVLVIEALERAVNMDGFDGLFRNEAEYVPDLIFALDAIGSLDVARLARAAIGALDITGEVTPDLVESAMDEDDEARDERFQAYDEAYYEIAGDLADPLLAYIKANRDQIVLP